MFDKRTYQLTSIAATWAHTESQKTDIFSKCRSKETKKEETNLSATHSKLNYSENSLTHWLPTLCPTWALQAYVQQHAFLGPSWVVPYYDASTFQAWTDACKHKVQLNHNIKNAICIQTRTHVYKHQYHHKTLF